MRSWACAVALVVVVVSVECQRRNQQGSGSPTNSNTRLGLISSQLGVPPVPTGQTGNLVQPNQPTGCYCLPVNQVCPNQVGNPNNPNTSGVGVFDVRIVNRPRPQGGICTDPEQKVCCLGGSNPIPNPGTFNPTGPFPVNPGNPFPVNPVRPNPVIPNPVQIGTCGVSNPIPYKQAAFAEAQFGEYPWMVVVLDLSNRYLGGGVLISPEWVLTAAHKVGQNMKARLGEHDVKSTQDHPQYPHVEVQIDRTIVHPGFNSQTLANDIALLHLSQPINTQLYPHIGTACLPAQGQLFFGQSCWVTGWGKDAFTNNGRFQHILKEVDVPMVEPFRCQARLRTSRLGQQFVLDSNSFVCAGGVEGKDACTGDGGAPLVCRSNRGWTVTGLVAWGIGCAQSEMPGVYVNVANYVNFIRQYVRV